MSKGICAVPECGTPVKRAGYCYGHYMKSWRYGTPTPEHAPRWVDLRGQRFGAVVVRERSSGGWLCDCDCGAETFIRAGDLNRGSAASCGARHIHVRRSDVGYGAAHDRLRKDRGSASTHSCVDCTNPAYHWSYDHTDPDERHEVIDGSLIAYSLNQDRYQPRCVPCHKRFDLARIDSASRLSA